MKQNHNEPVNIPNKKDILMININKFYQEQEHIIKILPVVTGKSKISLRLIDWFVTNYAKKNNTCLNIVGNTDVTNTRQFVVYINYKSQLKSYTKKQFDPFCRRERIRFFYDDNKFIITTVGQLNFFRWAIKNDIIRFISENIDIIEKDMNENIKKIKKPESLNEEIQSRKKRQELSISATKSINKHNINITVSFE